MKTLLYLSLLVITLVIGLLLSSHLVMEFSSMHRLTQIIQKYHGVLFLWRCGFYTIILALWPHFIKVIAARQKWSIETIVYLSKQRTKLLEIIVIIEVFFVYNFLGHLIVWLQ